MVAAASSHVHRAHPARDKPGNGQSGGHSYPILPIYTLWYIPLFITIIYIYIFHPLYIYIIIIIILLLLYQLIIYPLIKLGGKSHFSLLSSLCLLLKSH